MQSLRHFLPSLQTTTAQAGVDPLSSPELRSADAIDNKEKSSSEDLVLDADEMETDPATLHDPDLNPGGLTYTEGTLTCHYP